MKLDYVTITNREAQTSDTAVWRKDLGKNGCISAIDIGIRVTNGSVSAIDKDPLNLIKYINMIINGNDYRMRATGQQLFKYHWMKNGTPMPYTFTEAASGVQEIWFRLQFGRFLGDPLYGLDLSRFNNAQVQIEYDMTAEGAIANTTFTTGTFTITMIAHQFPANSRPMFRGMIGLHEFYTATTVASGDIVQSLPSQNPLLGLVVMAPEDATAEATDITDIKIGADSFAKVWVDGKWYNFQAQCNKDLEAREAFYTLLFTNAATKDCCMANIKAALIVANAATAGVA